MARIVGVEIPDNKRVEISLTYIHGIGLKTAQDILKSAKINPDTRTKDLTDTEIARLYDLIDKNQDIVVEGELKQRVFRNIKRLRDIRSYRGLRHKVGLPVRGQNTKRNARTRKGKIKMAVGGLKNKITKK